MLRLSASLDGDLGTTLCSSRCNISFFNVLREHSVCNQIHPGHFFFCHPKENWFTGHFLNGFRRRVMSIEKHYEKKSTKNQLKGTKWQFPPSFSFLFPGFPYFELIHPFPRRCVVFNSISTRKHGLETVALEPFRIANVTTKIVFKMVFSRNRQFGDRLKMSISLLMGNVVSLWMM